MPPVLLQLERLEIARGVENRAPHFMRSLVLAHAEAHRRADAEVDPLHPLERIDERLHGELAPGAPQTVDHELRREVPLERDEVRLLAHRILRQQSLVLE